MIELGTNLLQRSRSLLSSAPRAVSRRSTKLTLRQKLLVTFVSLAAMVGICGSAALIFFERIAGSVSTLSEVASPLLIESMAMIGNAGRMRSIVLDGDPNEDQQSALSRLDSEGREHVGKLKALSERAGLWAQFEPVQTLQQDFVATLQDIVEARAPNTKADRAASEGHALLRSKAKHAEAVLQAAARQFGNGAIDNEAASQALVQEGSATADVLGAQLLRTIGSYAVLENVHGLMRSTARVRELAQSALSIDGELDLDLIEGDAQRLFGTMSSLRQKLDTSTHTPEQEASLARVDALLDGLRAAFVGADGIVARKRKSLTTAARLTARLKKLHEIDTRYSDVLTGVATAVRSENDMSVLRTASNIVQGRAVISAVVGLAALLGLGAALFLTRSITTPLDRLTKHVRAIGERGNLIEISDRSLLEASDELGHLSRSFNGMIGELTAARQELIAKSEAEISKQVERLQAALTNMSQGLCMFDGDRRLIVSNKQYAEIYGVTPERVRPGMSLREILEQRVAAGSYYGDADTHIDQRIAANSESKASDTVVELKNGRSIHVVRRPMSGGGWVATHEDVTERRQLDAKIAHMARHDALTGLPNRTLFREKIDQVLAQMGSGQSIAVHYLDLDYFKSVNDTLGHSIGDALLRAVALRLLGCVRDEDTIARLGGDEFAIIQVVHDSQSEVAALADRIIETISRPYELDAHQAVVGVSIGIAIAPDDGREPGDLMKFADLALYRAKAEGRGRYRLFEPEMDARMQARRKLELDLRKALVAHEFELFYQPLINLRSAGIVAFEALLRWRHSERGLVAPADFIPALEEMALIVPVGEWVLREACRQAKAWPSTIKVTVNLSPLQFNSPRLVQAVEGALEDAGLPADQLELEITETVLLHDNEATLATLHQLRALGVKIAMDDFGTGYSSLSNLRSFPFDKIKIDRTFVRDLSKKEDSIAIIRAVTTLGRSLGIETTAEGVETGDQLERLRAEGCTEAQGYLFSPPVPADRINDLISHLAVGSGLAA